MGAHSKKKEPQLKMPHGSMRKVKSTSALGPKEAKLHGGPSQIGILDAEANQLLMNMGAIHASAPVAVPRPSAIVPAGGGQSVGPGVLGDELSEEELRDIFRERRENIERKFANAESRVPDSFMRSVPFQITSAAGQKLLMKGQAVARQGLSAGARPTSDTAFLTSVTEDEVEGGRPRRLME